LAQKRQGAWAKRQAGNSCLPSNEDPAAIYYQLTLPPNFAQHSLLMRSGQYFISLLLGAACLGLAAYVIILSRQNRELVQTVEQQQAEINRVDALQQFGRNLVRDMASVSTKNARIKELLMLNGFTISESPADVLKKP
jgi:hypothetical protein